MTIQQIKKTLRSMGNATIAAHSQHFFKTGKGEYGEGDKFLGVRVPELRKLAKQYYTSTSLEDVQKILSSPFHEERLYALLLLIYSFSKANEKEKTQIYNTYLSNTQYINSWDLVDLSSHHIIGAYLENKTKHILYQLSQSRSIWERRISIIATFQFIKKNQFNDTLSIAKQLINDKEDLIHKAVGWMLREIGKRNINIEKKFLKAYYKDMPRIMLRYAIEHFPKKERVFFLNKKDF